MNICPICQTSNADGAQYCVRCGSQLPRSSSTESTTAFPPPSPAESVERAEDLNFQAMQAVARNEIPEALELINRALATDPSHVPSIRTRVDILRRIGLATQAAVEEAKIQDIELGGRVYSGFWRRFMAWFLDGIFTFLLSIIPGAIAVAVIYLAIVPDNPTDSEREDALNNAVLGWYAVSGLVGFVYFWVLNARGGTWGKRAMGIRVVSSQTGENIGLRKSFVRLLIYWLGAGVLYLGWLWIIWDKNKQTWHDKAAGSVVVKSRKNATVYLGPA